MGLEVFWPQEYRKMSKTNSFILNLYPSTPPIYTKSVPINTTEPSPTLQEWFLQLRVYIAK